MEIDEIVNGIIRKYERMILIIAISSMCFGFIVRHIIEIARTQSSHDVVQIEDSNNGRG